MRRVSLRLRVVLLLLVVSQTAQARSIPTEPVQLSAADQREIRHVLGLDSTRAFSIEGFHVIHRAGAAPGTIARVRVAGEILAPSIESGRETRCYKSEATWTCEVKSSFEMLYASLPEECPAEVAPSVGGRFVPMLRGGGPSVEEALAIIDLICTSERMAEQAWALGHKVTSARRSADGELEVFTAAPDTDESGLVFVLKEKCDKDACQLVIGEKLGWNT